MTHNKRRRLRAAIAGSVLFTAMIASAVAAADSNRELTLSWNKEMLTIRGDHLPGGRLEIWYLEAFCRPGSTRRDWKQTVIPHTTQLIKTQTDKKLIKLQSRVSDGVVVDHEI